MDAQSIIVEIFSAPVGWNIALGCFIAAVACMAVSYHRRIQELKKQGAAVIALLEKIESKAH